MERGEWSVESGEWSVESGEWSVESGEWSVESGMWRVESGVMEREKTARFKSKKFAVRIVNLYRYLCEEKKEFVLSKQILRSGTSIGANLAEAEAAISKRDFLAKVYIALKECTETQYWIELLRETDYLTEEQFQSLSADCEELRKMLSSTTKTILSTLNTPNSKLSEGGEAE